MGKRKKYPKLPNGFGTIKTLSGNRTNSLGVYPPVTEFDLNGSPKSPAALAYVNDWFKGFGVLTAYHSGTFEPGQEIPDYLECDNKDELLKHIITEYNTEKRKRKGIVPGKTFKEVYADFFAWKFEQDKSKTYSISTKRSANAAYKNFSSLHTRTFKELQHDDYQQEIDHCTLKYSSLELMVSLLHQMYAYADIYSLVEKDCSAHLKINIPDDDESGIPFTETQLLTLWKHKSDPTVALILIMCYSGYRIEAYKNMEVNLTETYFRGGVKTKQSKNRVVPIHSAVLPLVKHRMSFGEMIDSNTNAFRKLMYLKLEELGIEKHTPHDCRHTFSMLCEKYGVNENDRKRMLGHSFGADITNAKYGHRSVEELRKEIEKIKICR